MARRVSGDAPRHRRRLIVIAVRRASPEKRLDTRDAVVGEQSLPVLARASMMAASAGRFATSTRPSSRSYHRNAGMPSMAPCRMPSWLAGVVQGSCGVHSSRPCVPSRSQRLMVGRFPACRAHRRTGIGTPSSWTKSTPSTSASASLRPMPPTASHEGGGERLVGAGRCDPGQQCCHDRRSPRGDDCLAEGSDSDARSDDKGHVQDQCLADDRQRQHSDPTDASRHADQDRPYDRADHDSDDRGDGVVAEAARPTTRGGSLR